MIWTRIRYGVQSKGKNAGNVQHNSTIFHVHSDRLVRLVLHLGHGVHDAHVAHVQAPATLDHGALQAQDHDDQDPQSPAHQTQGPVAPVHHAHAEVLLVLVLYDREIHHVHQVQEVVRPDAQDAYVPMVHLGRSYHQDHRGLLGHQGLHVVVVEVVVGYGDRDVREARGGDHGEDPRDPEAARAADRCVGGRDGGGGARRGPLLCEVRWVML
ncbi:hypothetical protein BJX62DRAFT_215327 [Aspergillus germanicus]